MKFNKVWDLVVKLVSPNQKKQISRKLKTNVIKDEVILIRGVHHVSNIVVSSGDTGSKKAYWQKSTGSRFSLCQIAKCTNLATVGGHVWIKGFQSTETVYILPLCQVQWT